jgi:hypothetical protein
MTSFATGASTIVALDMAGMVAHGEARSKSGHAEELRIIALTQPVKLYL